jgi:uncharacterized protein (DUF362 family)
LNPHLATRRAFLKKSILGTAGVTAAWRMTALGDLVRADALPSRVVMTKGDDRADNAFRAMQMLKKSIATAIGNKRVIVKPNVVNDIVALADTHVDWLEGILEFLKSIGKTDITIAESNPRSTWAAFEMMGYFRLTNKYPVQFVEMNQEGADRVQVWKDDTTLWPIRVSKLLRNPNNFIISCPRIKTHNNAVATMALKNVVMSAPMVDPGFYYGQQGATKFNKTPGMHGSPPVSSPTNANQYLNDNIYRLAKFYGIHPHLSVIDGYQGMEGNGPSSGTAVASQKLGIASLDWVAADRVCVQLMGHDVYPLGTTGPFPAYLNYCGQAGLGEWDLNKIEVIGESIAGNVVSYAPHPTIKSQIAEIRTTPKE